MVSNSGWRWTAAVIVMAIGIGSLAAGAGILLEDALGGAGRRVMEGKPVVAPLSTGKATGAARTVTLVAVPGLDLAFLRQLRDGDPRWRRLLDQAALGLMVSNTAEFYGREAGYLSLGAGARAVSGSAARWAMAADTPLGPADAGRLFAAWTAGSVGGLSPETPLPDLPPVVHWGWHQLTRANAKLHHAVHPGALGEVLGQSGIATAALGNADLLDGPWAEVRRGAPLVTADAQGYTPYGLIDRRALRPDPRFPGGWRTDWARLLEAWRQLQGRAGLVVLEAGDLGRLESLRDVVAPPRWEAARWSAAQELGSALAWLLARREPDQRVILLNPAPSDGERYQGQTLMPVALWGAGPGLLTTASTRRAGLITNVDVAPTIAAQLVASPAPHWLGRPLAVVPGPEDPLAALTRLNQAFVANYQRRPFFIRAFVLAGLVLTAWPLIDLWRRRRRRWRTPLLTWAALPLGLLLVPAWPIVPVAVALAAAVLGALILAALAVRLAPSLPGAFAAVGLWTTAAVLADAAQGGWLAQLTPFGYSPIGGARFYGIGNEYMGVVLGAAAVFAGGWAEHGRWRGLGRMVIPGVLLGVAAVMASPLLGSNFGGALSAAVAALGPALTESVGRWRRRSAWRRFLWVAVAPAAAAATMVLWDRQMGLAATHVSLLMEQVRSGGMGVLEDIITRKVAMNLKLMRYTNWSYLFVVMVLAFAYLMYRRTSVVRSLERCYPETVQGLTAVAAGALAALVLNDSGLVAAALTLLYGISLLLALATVLELPAAPAAPRGQPPAAQGSGGCAPSRRLWPRIWRSLWSRTGIP